MSSLSLSHVRHGMGTVRPYNMDRSRYGHSLNRHLARSNASAMQWDRTLFTSRHRSAIPCWYLKSATRRIGGQRSGRSMSMLRTSMSRTNARLPVEQHQSLRRRQSHIKSAALA